MSDQKLYRVYVRQDKDEGKPLYLPAGPGLPLDEAERLHKATAADTFIHCVYTPEGDDE